MMPIRLSILAVLVVAAVGCHGSAPRPHAGYYQSWENIPPQLRDDLDTARRGADDDYDSPEALLRYARVTTKLARVAGENWIQAVAAADEGGPGGAAREARADRARIRLLECCNHSLTIYNEVRLTGTRLPWQDRVAMAWLLVLSGLDEEAREIIDGTLADPNIPDTARGDLVNLRGRLDELPPQDAP